MKLNEGLESIGGEGEGVFENSGVEEIYIPSSLREIGDNTFAGCEHLKSVHVADGCKVVLKPYVPFDVKVVSAVPDVSSDEESPSSI